MKKTTAPSLEAVQALDEKLRDIQRQGSRLTLSGHLYKVIKWSGRKCVLRYTERAQADKSTFQGDIQGLFWKIMRKRGDVLVFGVPMRIREVKHLRLVLEVKHGGALPSSAEKASGRPLEEELSPVG